MLIDRLFIKLTLGADRELDNENWVKERGQEIPNDSGRAPQSPEYTEVANVDVHTVGRIDPVRNLVVPDHAASVLRNRKANRDILTTIWSGHQLDLAKAAVKDEKLKGGQAAWAYSLAFVREAIGFPLLAVLAYAENRGHIEYHRRILESAETGSRTRSSPQLG